MTAPQSSLRRQWLAVGVGALAVAAGGAGVWWQRCQERMRDTEVEGPAGLWRAQFDQPGGDAFLVGQWRGQPLLVNFWATWCAPCVEEMPMLDAYFRQHGGKNFQMIGLAIDQMASVRKFLDRTPVSYPVGVAMVEGTRLLRELSNGAGSLPFSVMLDAAGQIQGRKIGQLQVVDLEAWRQAVTHG